MRAIPFGVWRYYLAKVGGLGDKMKTTPVRWTQSRHPFRASDQGHEQDASCVRSPFSSLLATADAIIVHISQGRDDASLLFDQPAGDYRTRPYHYHSCSGIGTGPLGPSWRICRTWPLDRCRAGPAKFIQEILQAKPMSDPSYKSEDIYTCVGPYLAQIRHRKYNFEPTNIGQKT